MAERVIVVGSRRGMERVPVSEMMQMIGRAGRTHGVEVCHAEVILDSKDFADVASKMDEGGKLEVQSSLSTDRDVAFHILPQVCDGGITMVSELERWASRTFMSFQGNPINVDSALELLERCGGLKLEGGSITPTMLGRIASKYYFHIEDVRAWMDNFTELFELGLENEEAGAAWALGNVPVARNIGDFSDRWEIVGDCKAQIPESLLVREGSLINVVLWWCVMGGAPAGKMRHKAVAMKADFSRIKRVLCEIDASVARWGQDEFFDNLEIRVRRGIPMCIFELCRIGLSKSMAYHLYSMGVTDRESLRECMSTMSLDIDERGMSMLKRVVNEAI